MMSYIRDFTLEKIKNIFLINLKNKRRLIFVMAVTGLISLCVGDINNYRIGDFPDEKAHLGYVENVRDNGFPDYKDGKIYGESKLNYLQHPFLYYAISGYLFKFIDHVDDDSAKIIRLVNVVIVCLIFFVIYKMMKKMELEPFSMLFGFLFLLSIPMFSILGASINNDPLSVLGCALISSALISFHLNETRFISLLALGFLIVSLTKLTAVLVFVCMMIPYFALNMKASVFFFKRVKNKDYIPILLMPIIVFIYYGLVYTSYHEIFPRPHFGPDQLFKINNPNAPRWGVLEHLVEFYESNLMTISKPYGHTIFPDLSIREKLFEVLFATYPVLLFLVIKGEIKKKSIVGKIYIPLFISQLLFLMIYFIFIRKAHVETGYPGGMQARYFFGFLPIISVIISAGFSKLGFKLKIIFFVLALLSTSMLYYVGYYSLMHPFSCFQERADTAINELVSGGSFSQSFISKGTRIERITLLLATYNRVNTGYVILEVLDEKGGLIAKSIRSAGLIKDNSWADFNFSEAKIAKGKLYQIKLIAPDSNPGNAITWLALSKKNGEKDPFPEGNSYVDGLRSNFDFAFGIYF